MINKQAERQLRIIFTYLVQFVYALIPFSYYGQCYRDELVSRIEKLIFVTKL